jgi:hypothetical protein
MTASAATPEVEADPRESAAAQFLNAARSGNLGSWPVIIALAFVGLYFWQTAGNFATPGNFTRHHHADGGNLPDRLRRDPISLDRRDHFSRLRQRCRGVVVAGTAADGRASAVVRLRFLAILAAALIGAFRGRMVALVSALVRGHALVRIWQGVILSRSRGVIVIRTTGSTTSRTISFCDSRLDHGRGH